MGACASKPKKRKSGSDSLLEDRLKQDAFVRKESNSSANGYKKTSTTVVRTLLQNNRLVSSTTTQSVSISGSNPLMRPSLTENFIQEETISTGFSPGQVFLPARSRPSYSAVFQSPAIRSAMPTTINSGTKLGAVKYDLSKKAYVLVLHHYIFQDAKLNRYGSERDMDRIRSFFQHYRVDRLNVNENQTVAKVRSIMDKIASKNFSDYSCLIIIIMSHGLENDQIEAHDGSYCFDRDVVEKCTSNRTLNGKPKLFIVQACRGKSTVATDSKQRQSHKNDVLIFQSTYKGFVAFRDTQNGTFFIQNFFGLLNEHRDEDISLINKHLNRVFAQNGISQNPTMCTILRKDFLFADLRQF